MIEEINKKLITDPAAGYVGFGPVRIRTDRPTLWRSCFPIVGSHSLTIGKLILATNVTPQ
jgi:hypothetical protein